jgi:thiamine biosynthesis lipoprotein
MTGKCRAYAESAARGGPSRRRFLALFAFAAAVPGRPGAAERKPARWQGRAFGADATITIDAGDGADARRALAAAVAEIGRLEQALSLYRPDSALVRLNATGHLDDPPPMLCEVLAAAAQVSEISDGAFDATVQPLWQAHLRAARDPQGLDAAIERARERIGWRKVRLGPHRLSFDRPGMAVTLNGIAQGYAADRIAEVLRREGFDRVLADLGEHRAVGGRAAGQPWQIGIERPGNGHRLADGIAAVVALTDRGLATSSPFGTPLDRLGTRHHLFDPRTGRSAASWASVSVIAPTAMTADALSTAMAVAPADAAAAILAGGGGIEAVLIDFEGRVRRLRA